MKRLSSHTQLVMAVIMTTAALAACGNSTSTVRNAEGDAVACVSQSDSTIGSDGQLELHFCAQATQWVREDEGATYSDKMLVADGKATTSILGLRSMKILTYDADGQTVGIDKITVNGSRGGTIFDVSVNKDATIFYEVAPASWSGSSTDPKLTRPSIATEIEKFNNTTAPAGDWFHGNFSEMKRLLSKADVAKTAGIIGDARYDWYWVNNEIPEKNYYGAQRVAFAPYGFLSFYVVSAKAATTVKEYVRPIRTFTNGDGPDIIVTAGFSATSESSTSTTVSDATGSGMTTTSVDTSVSSSETPDVISTTTSTTIAAEASSIAPTSVTPTSTTTEPEQITRRSIINPTQTNVKLSVDDKAVIVSPSDVKDLIAAVSPTPAKSVEIQVDGGEWLTLSTSQETSIAIPPDAKTANIRVTSQSGDAYSITKSISRDGVVVTTTTETPTQEASNAAPVPGQESKSDNGTGFGVVSLGIPLLLIVAALGFMRVRRRRHIQK